MKREVSFEEISDGKLYERNDLVKANCHGCEGCSDCCKGMGESIVLDPYDTYQLQTGLALTFEQLLLKGVALGVQEGVILPHLKMQETIECCSFLDENERCSIHSIRPSICRLFPLGRFYEEEGFRYFLQVHECTNQERSKIKVKKWIGMENLAAHENFINHWSTLVRTFKSYISHGLEEAKGKELNLYFLKLFFLVPYEQSMSFYEQFTQREKQFYNELEK